MNRASARTRRVLTESGAILWLLVCAGGFLAPALAGGKAIGPYDLLHVLGLTSGDHGYVHNAVASDQIQQFIPWQVLSWLQVHAGIVPFWQPANLLGMPLASDFQSAPFGLANVVGYAFPLALAHSATIATELVVAGTGTYVLCRTLRLGVLPSVVGATIFELCGAFTIWLGVYEADVCSLLPWVLAASLLVVRRRRRAVPVTLLAMGLALAFAAGEPQIDVFFILFVGVFAVVVALGDRRLVRLGAGAAAVSGAGAAGSGGAGAGAGGSSGSGAVGGVVGVGGVGGVGNGDGDGVANGDGSGNGGGPPGRALLAHLGALAVAVGLVAPIYLPAGQVLTSSARVHGPYVSSLPPHDLTHLLFVGYSGVPTNLASIVGPDNLYVSMVYVGSVGLVLALVGLVWLRRRPEVLAFAILTVVLLVALFAPPVAAILRQIPEAKVFRLDLGATFLDFGFAMLAAFGAQALAVTTRRARRRDAGPEVGRGARTESEHGAGTEVGRGGLHDAWHGGSHDAGRTLRRWTDRLLLAGTVFLGLGLAVLEVRLGIGLGHLSTTRANVRQASFLWPTIGVASCALVAIARTALGQRAASATGASSRLRVALARATGLLAGRGGLALLIGAEATMCILGGAWFLSSTPDPLRTTPAIMALQRDTDGQLVAMGTCPSLHAFPNLGIMPDVNAAYGVDELVDYDPIMTTQYYAALGALLGTSKTPPAGENALFCPEISSVRAARFFGAAYVLEPAGSAGPSGTKLVAHIRDEELYAVPDSGRATLIPLTSGSGGGQDGRWSNSWEGTATTPPVVEPARESESGTWTVQVDAHERSLLVLRVTAVPGWQASIDGRPLPLRTYDTLLLTAVVPPGRHVVVLHYWPGLLTVGLVIAAVAGGALVATLGWAAWGSRRRARRPPGLAAGSHRLVPRRRPRRARTPAHARASHGGDEGESCRSPIVENFLSCQLPGHRPTPGTSGPFRSERATSRLTPLTS